MKFSALAVLLIPALALFTIPDHAHAQEPESFVLEEIIVNRDHGGNREYTFTESRLSFNSVDGAGYLLDMLYQRPPETITSGQQFPLAFKGSAKRSTNDNGTSAFELSFAWEGEKTLKGDFSPHGIWNGQRSEGGATINFTITAPDFKESREADGLGSRLTLILKSGCCGNPDEVEWLRYVYRKKAEFFILMHHGSFRNDVEKFGE